MFQYSLIDFDDTLFETSRMKKDIESVFLRYDIKNEDFLSSYRQAVAGDTGAYYNYSFLGQIELLRKMGYKLPDQMLVELDQLLNNNYQAKDAEDFLRFIKKVSNQTILLTAGNKIFQKQKLHSTSLMLYFDEVIILPEKKENKVGEYYSKSENILLVEDSVRKAQLVHELYPKITVIIKTNFGRYSLEDYQSTGLPFFDSLTEIRKYIE